MPEIEVRGREAIADFLPSAIETALDSYQRFSEAQITDTDSTPTSKQFKDHHDACKVAIAHIKLLIELAKWADLPDPELSDKNDQRMLLEIIERGRQESDKKG